MEPSQGQGSQQQGGNPVPSISERRMRRFVQERKINRGYQLFVCDYEKMALLVSPTWDFSTPESYTRCSNAWQNLSALERDAYQTAGAWDYVPPTEAQKLENPTLWNAVAAVVGKAGLRLAIHVADGSVGGGGAWQDNRVVVNAGMNEVAALPVVVRNMVEDEERANAEEDYQVNNVDNADAGQNLPVIVDLDVNGANAVQYLPDIMDLDVNGEDGDGNVQQQVIMQQNENAGDYVLYFRNANGDFQQRLVQPGRVDDHVIQDEHQPIVAMDVVGGGGDDGGERDGNDVVDGPYPNDNNVICNPVGQQQHLVLVADRVQDDGGAEARRDDESDEQSGVAVGHHHINPPGGATVELLPIAQERDGANGRGRQGRENDVRVRGGRVRGHGRTASGTKPYYPPGWPRLPSSSSLFLRNEADIIRYQNQIAEFLMNQAAAPNPPPPVPPHDANDEDQNGAGEEQ